MPTVDVGTGEVTANLDAGVLVVTLNRPEVRNAVSRDLLEGLARAVEVAASSEEVRAVLLTGAGPAFCAGGDVSLMAAGRSTFGAPDDPEGRAAVQTDLQRRTVVRLHDLQKPTIAAIPGAAVGAGLSLALACDVRVAAVDATLATGFARVGLAGDFGCSWLLHRLAGRAVARELLYGARPMAAADAERRGLVNLVVEPDRLAVEAMRMARSFARIPVPAAEVIGETAELVTELTFAQACDRDALHHARLSTTPEHRDAVLQLVRSIEEKAAR